MPLYEYECKKCHHRFERIQKFSDPHLKKCPDCRGPVELVISAPAVQFKGSGWYVTDYAKKSSSPGSANGDSGSQKEAKPKTEESTQPETSKKAESSGKSESSAKKNEKSSQGGPPSRLRRPDSG